jgi:hypothetical protein
MVNGEGTPRTSEATRPDTGQTATQNFERGWALKVLVGLAAAIGLGWLFVQRVYQRSSVGSSGTDYVAMGLFLGAAGAASQFLQGLWFLCVKQTIWLTADSIVVSLWGKQVSREDVRHIGTRNWGYIDRSSETFLTSWFPKPTGGLTLILEGGHVPKVIRLEDYNTKAFLQLLRTRNTKVTPCAVVPHGKKPASILFGDSKYYLSSDGKTISISAEKQDASSAILRTDEHGHLYLSTMGNCWAFTAGLRVNPGDPERPVSGNITLGGLPLRMKVYSV